MKLPIHFVTRFFSLFRRKTVLASMTPPRVSGAEIAQMIITTEEDEIDCAQAFDLMHQYADLVSRDQDVGVILPAVQRHIEMCRDCREELEALLVAIQSKRDDHVTNGIRK